MNIWIVIFLAAIKQELNCSYDRLTSLANPMDSVRQMMGHGTEDTTRYTRQTIQDNVTSVTPKFLQELNQLIVRVGHQVVGHREDDVLKCHVDSKVSLTNVEYPTDLRLLWNSTKSLIQCCVMIALRFGLSGWRQHESIKEKLEKRSTFSRKGRRSTYRFHRIKKLLNYSNWIGEKAREVLQELSQQEQEIKERLDGHTPSAEDQKMLDEIHHAKQKICLYLDYGARFSDQIIRRVFHNETIPTAEKVYSIYKPFTRWIVKGKAGILCELGVPVAVMEDSYPFILGYGIEWEGTDKDRAVPLVQSIESQYPHLIMTCSFDLGFYSPEVRQQLETQTNLVTVGMSKRGRLSKQEKERQNTEAYKEARQGIRA